MVFNLKDNNQFVSDEQQKKNKTIKINTLASKLERAKLDTKYNRYKINIRKIK